MTEQKSQISGEDILGAIEASWDFQLPREYREFLLTISVGTFENKVFSFHNSEDGSCIGEFFTLKKGMRNFFIDYRNMQERIPNNFIPIASDVYGNRILLAVKNPDRGKIFFWDHELEAGDGEVPDYSNLTLIAPDFQTFFDSLRPEDDED